MTSGVDDPPAKNHKTQPVSWPAIYPPTHKINNFLSVRIHARTQYTTLYTFSQTVSPMFASYLIDIFLYYLIPHMGHA